MLCYFYVFLYTVFFIQEEIRILEIHLISLIIKGTSLYFKL